MIEPSAFLKSQKADKMFEDFTYVNESAMTRNSSRNTHTIEEHGESDEASETQD